MKALVASLVLALAAGCSSNGSGGSSSSGGSSGAASTGARGSSGGVGSTGAAASSTGAAAGSSTAGSGTSSAGASSGGSTSSGASSGAGASSAGSSTSGASASTGGGTAASSGGSTTGSTGAGTSAGISTGGILQPDGGWPADAGVFSLNCSGEDEVFAGVLPSSEPLADLSIAPLPSGAYLIGVLLGAQGVGAQFIALSPDGGAADAGVQPCADGSDDCPYFALRLVSTGSGAPPTMIAGYFPPFSAGTGTDMAACWSPYGGTSPTPIDLSSVGSGANAADVQVDVLRAAVSGPQVAIAVTDLEGFQDVFDVGAPGAGCPDPDAAVLLNSGNVIGAALAPSWETGTPFLTAEALSGDPDELAISAQPGGAPSRVPYGSVASQAVPRLPAIASDGTSYVALTQSDSAGLQLFTGSVAGVTPGADAGVLAPAPVFALTAANCGVGCTVAGWIAGTDGGVDGGPEVPSFAFIDSQGSAQTVTMAPITDDADQTALTAVASQPGSAVIAYASSYYDDVTGNERGRVHVMVCTP